MSSKKVNYSLGEEIFNAITHGVGAVFSIVALVLMIVVAVMFGNSVGLIASIIYGVSLIVLYLMSTLYHAITHEKAKQVFRVFDHCSIFLLIAGTYTPITLVTLAGVTGYTIFGIIWACAIVGIVLNSISIERFKKISMALYFIMGWFAIFAMGSILGKFNAVAISLLVAGGLAYTLGIIFYALQRRCKFMHSIWHLFVLAGSVLHFLLILIYVIPVQGV